MTDSDAHNAALHYLRLGMICGGAVLVLSAITGVWVVSAPDVHETEAYAPLRKVLALGYSLIATSLLVWCLLMMARANAAIAVARDGAGESGAAVSLLRPISTLYGLFPMAAIIITVNYIILIYVVDGGLF